VFSNEFDTRSHKQRGDSQINRTLNKLIQQYAFVRNKAHPVFFVRSIKVLQAYQTILKTVI